MDYGFMVTVVYKLAKNRGGGEETSTNKTMYIFKCYFLTGNNGHVSMRESSVH